MIKITDIYKHILTEARWRDISERYRKLWDGRNSDYYKNYNQGNNFDSFDEVIQHFRDNDPTDNGKYLQFFLDKSFNTNGNTSSSFLIDLINDFHRLSEKGYIKNRDIYSPDYRSSGMGLELFEPIYTAINEAKNKEASKQLEKEKEVQLRTERDVIYEDGRWRVIIPKTYEASCHYGQGTKWCTTEKGTDRYFKSYISKGIVYYLIDKTKSMSDGVMYRVAINWPWKKDHNDNKIPTELVSSGWFDATDSNIRASHILPLLPTKMVTAITDYYNTRIEFDNNDTSHLEVFDKLSDYLTSMNMGALIEERLRGGDLDSLPGSKMEGGVKEISTDDYNNSGFEINIYFNSGLEIESFYLGTSNDNKPELYDFKSSISSEVVKEVSSMLTPDNTSRYGFWSKFVSKIFNRVYSEAMVIATGPDTLGKFLSNGEDKVFSEETVEFFVEECYKSLRIFVANSSSFGYYRKDTHKKVGDTVMWKANNTSSTFAFKYPPKEGNMTDRFIKAIKKNPGITVKEFYKSEDREYRPGHNTQFFGSIKDSGIVKQERGPYGAYKYYLGPNYEDWTKGKLKKYEE